ncbi:hypothetical protein [Streptococcus gallolyticus]|uniref:hypothetical protein n=1 Tax=Streptococcus gallolyticus TaxID=315405 RepID=UPI00228405C8|nr:hypothetical protein [Streptococcus gallolyticus]MCY7187270.1 hypothetical protein [Streptococcus gallolyticus subsp. gallolyticus]
MRAKTVQEFIGIIILDKNDDKGTSCYTVEFYDKGTFCSTEYVLEQIEEKFGEVYNKDFIKDLKEAIETYKVKQEDFCAAYMERELVNAIEEAESFEDIQFDECDLPFFSYYLNEKIKDGSYLYERKY